MTQDTLRIVVAVMVLSPLAIVTVVWALERRRNRRTP